MINEFAMYTGAAVIEMVLDVTNLVMPWPVIWKLANGYPSKMGYEQDLHVGWIVSRCIVIPPGLYYFQANHYNSVCISSIIRLYYLIGFLNPLAQQPKTSLVRPPFSTPAIHSPPTNSAHEFRPLTDSLANIIIWSTIEPCADIICVCLPTLGPIFQGGSSPESFLGRIKTILTIRSF